MVLIAWSATSQEGTVRLPESRARLIALDLVELDRLRANTPLLELEIAAKDNRIETLQQITQRLQEQLVLAGRLADSYREELEIERQTKKGENVFTRILTLLGAAAVGVVVGLSL